jgi:hypothetical protein
MYTHYLHGLTRYYTLTPRTNIDLRILLLWSVMRVIMCDLLVEACWPALSQRC